MSHPPDWVPHHCGHCMTYMGHGEDYRAECPEECDCGSPNHAASFVCPTCGYKWRHTPPEDWGGELLYSPESEITPPPPYYADSLDDSLLYAGEKWTRENIYNEHPNQATPPN